MFWLHIKGSREVTCSFHWLGLDKVRHTSQPYTWRVGTFSLAHFPHTPVVSVFLKKSELIHQNHVCIWSTISHEKLQLTLAVIWCRYTSDSIHVIHNGFNTANIAERYWCETPARQNRTFRGNERPKRLQTAADAKIKEIKPMPEQPLSRLSIRMKNYNFEVKLFEKTDQYLGATREPFQSTCIRRVTLVASKVNITDVLGIIIPSLGGNYPAQQGSVVFSTLPLNVSTSGIGFLLPFFPLRKD